MVLQPWPCQTEAVEALARALQAAAKEWADAEVADSDYQQLLASMGELAAVVQAEVVALRRTLAAVVAGPTRTSSEKASTEDQAIGCRGGSSSA